MTVFEKIKTDSRHWIKGNYRAIRPNGDGRFYTCFCLMGAIHEVTRDAMLPIEARTQQKVELVDKIYAAIVSLYPTEVDSVYDEWNAHSCKQNAIIKWNDNIATYEQVVAVIKEAGL